MWLTLQKLSNINRSLWHRRLEHFSLILIIHFTWLMAHRCQALLLKIQKQLSFMWYNQLSKECTIFNLRHKLQTHSWRSVSTWLKICNSQLRETMDHLSLLYRSRAISKFLSKLMKLKFLDFLWCQTLTMTKLRFEPNSDMPLYIAKLLIGLKL